MTVSTAYDPSNPIRVTVSGGVGPAGADGAVFSVNGLAGTITLSSISVSAASAVHSHAASDITSGTLDAARLPTISYTSLSNVPATFTPATHTHDASAIQAGTMATARLPIATATAVGVVSVTSGLSVTSGGALSANVRSVAGRTGDVTLTLADVTAAAASHQHAASDITSGTLPMGRLALPSDSDLRALSSSASVVTPDGLMRAVGNIAIRPWTSLLASAGGGTYGGYVLATTGAIVGTTSTSYAELLAAGPYDGFVFGAGAGPRATVNWSLPMSVWVRFSHMNNGANDFADGQRVRVLMCSAASNPTLGTAAPSLRCVGWEFQRNGTAGSLSVFAHNGTTLTSVSALIGLNQFPYGLLRLRTDGLGNAYVEGTISDTSVSASVAGAPTGTVQQQECLLKASYYNTLATASVGTMWFSTAWVVS